MALDVWYWFMIWALNVYVILTALFNINSIKFAGINLVILVEKVYFSRLLISEYIVCAVDETNDFVYLGSLQRRVRLMIDVSQGIWFNFLIVYWQCCYQSMIDVSLTVKKLTVFSSHRIGLIFLWRPSWISFDWTFK